MRWRLYVGSKLSIALAGLMIGCAGLMIGCGGPNSSDVRSTDRDRDRLGVDQSGPSTSSVTKAPLRSGPRRSRQSTLNHIRLLIQKKDWDKASLETQSYLVQYPDDLEGLLFASQVEAASKGIDQAMAMLDGFVVETAKDAERITIQGSLLLAQAERWLPAIDRLEAHVVRYPESNACRSELADLLNARGFRFDANEHVRYLCKRSQATVSQLRGLMTPSRSFTGFSEKPDLKNQEVLRQLGIMNVARGLLSEGDVAEAANLLQDSDLIRARHPAALAFYGRVLLESQRFAEFERWLAEAGPECRRYPAFWLALGGWALRSEDPRAAVRMFGEAILRDPGSLAANDRMTLALAAAALPEASDRFRERGVEISQVIQVTRQFLEQPNAGFGPIGEISSLLAQIGRPVESLEWMRVGLERIGAPPDAMQQYRVALAESQKQEFRDAAKQDLLCRITLDEFSPGSLLDQKGRSFGDLADRTASSIETTTIPVPKASQPAFANPAFANIAEQVGIDFRYRNGEPPVNRELLIFQQLGGGVACLDYDMDGRLDFYLCQAAGNPPKTLAKASNLLFRQLERRFDEVTRRARCEDRRYTGGVTVGDWNQDGFPDIVVANLQQNTFFINQGDGTFRVDPGNEAWRQPTYTSSLAMADVNGDHLPDIVEINYLDDPDVFLPIERKPDGSPVRLPAPLHFQPAVDRIFLSRGDGGMTGQVLGDPDRPLRSTGLGIIVTDVDGKVGNEILVANDNMANHFWEWERDAASKLVWRETAAVRGLATGASGAPLGCMGIAAADFDRNGRLDFHITNIEDQWSNHFVQSEQGFFEDLVVAYGLSAPTYSLVGFGTQAIDFDNNSVVDLVIGNGHIDDLVSSGKSPFEMPTQVFTFDQSRFRPLQVVGDDAYWKTGHITRALALCDWNRDGRMDFVTTDLRQPFSLLENRTETDCHWIQIKLVGTRSERDAIGTRITASFSQQDLTQVVQAGDGYMCRNEPILSLGLGDAASLDRLEIRWPTGETQVFNDLAGDRRWLIVESEPDAFQLNLR